MRMLGRLACWWGDAFSARVRPGGGGCGGSTGCAGTEGAGSLGEWTAGGDGHKLARIRSLRQVSVWWGSAVRFPSRPAPTRLGLPDSPPQPPPPGLALRCNVGLGPQGVSAFGFPRCCISRRFSPEAQRADRHQPLHLCGAEHADGVGSAAVRLRSAVGCIA